MTIGPHLSISPYVAGYTRRVAEQLDREGMASRAAVNKQDADRWRSRMANAARASGFIIETHWDGQRVTATLMGWKP